MSKYIIRKELFDKFYGPQKEVLLSNYFLNENGDIEIDFEPKKYTVNDTKPKFKKGIKAISLFSGAGGLDIGCQLAGVKVISSLDIFGDSVETLKLNPYFSHTTHEVGDITKINGKHYSSLLKKEKPEKLILIGGPPCQPFSKAGYWVTNKKRDSFSDPRNLITPYFNLIADLKPDGFLLENVESILHPSNRESLELIEKSINKLGYYFEMFKINAADYGIPQKRKRVFFIATKRPINSTLHPTHFPPNRLKKNGKPYSRVIDWIGDISSDNESLAVTGKWSEELKKIPFGKNYMALSKRDGYPEPVFIAGKRYWTSLLKLNPLEPSWTIIASPGHWEGPFHWENRRLSIEEIAAIQTFPRDYIFYGSYYSAHKQIGNAVPPLLAKIIVEELIKWL